MEECERLVCETLGVRSDDEVSVEQIIDLHQNVFHAVAELRDAQRAVRQVSSQNGGLPCSGRWILQVLLEIEKEREKREKLFWELQMLKSGRSGGSDGETTETLSKNSSSKHKTKQDPKACDLSSLLRRARRLYVRLDVDGVWGVLPSLAPSHVTSIRLGLISPTESDVLLLLEYKYDIIKERLYREMLQEEHGIGRWESMEPSEQTDCVCDLEQRADEALNLRDVLCMCKLPGILHCYRNADEGASLSCPYQQGASLSCPYQQWASLSCPYQQGASLSCPYQQGASLSCPYQQGTSLSCTYEQGASLSCPDQEGASLSHHDQEGASLSRHDQEGASLSCHDQEGASLSRHDQEGVSLSCPDQEGASLCRPDQEGASLSRPDQEGASLSCPDQEGTSLSRPDQAGASLSCPDQEGASLSHPDQEAASLSCPEQEGASLSRPEQEGASLSHPDQEEASLSRPNQEEASLSRPEQEGASLSCPDQGGASLSCPEQEGASLSRPEQEGASLSCPDQEEESLSRPNQEEASLSRPEQEGASLSCPDQGGASLSRPDQEGALLFRPEQEGALLSSPDQQGASLSRPDQEGVSLSCPDQEGASLCRPDQEGASLSRPDQEGASLCRPDQQGTSLSLPDQEGASLCRPDQEGASLSCPVEGLRVRQKSWWSSPQEQSWTAAIFLSELRSHCDEERRALTLLLNRVERLVLTEIYLSVCVAVRRAERETHSHTALLSSRQHWDNWPCVRRTAVEDLVKFWLQEKRDSASQLRNECRTSQSVRQQAVLQCLVQCQEQERKMLVEILQTITHEKLQEQKHTLTPDYSGALRRGCVSVLKQIKSSLQSSATHSSASWGDCAVHLLSELTHTHDQEVQSVIHTLPDMDFAALLLLLDKYEIELRLPKLHNLHNLLQTSSSKNAHISGSDEQRPSATSVSEERETCTGCGVVLVPEDAPYLEILRAVEKREEERKSGIKGEKEDVERQEEEEEEVKRREEKEEEEEKERNVGDERRREQKEIEEQERRERTEEEEMRNVDAVEKQASLITLAWSKPTNNNTQEVTSALPEAQTTETTSVDSHTPNHTHSASSQSEHTPTAHTLVEPLQLPSTSSMDAQHESSSDEHRTSAAGPELHSETAATGDDIHTRDAVCDAVCEEQHLQREATMRSLVDIQRRAEQRWQRERERQILRVQERLSIIQNRKSDEDLLGLGHQETFRHLNSTLQQEDEQQQKVLVKEKLQQLWRERSNVLQSRRERNTTEFKELLTPTAQCATNADVLSTTHTHTHINTTHTHLNTPHTNLNTPRTP